MAVVFGEFGREGLSRPGNTDGSWGETADVNANATLSTLRLARKRRIGLFNHSRYRQDLRCNFNSRSCWWRFWFSWVAMKDVCKITVNSSIQVSITINSCNSCDYCNSCPFLRPSARPSDRPSVRLSVCSSICPSVRPSVCIHTSLWTEQFRNRQRAESYII